MHVMPDSIFTKIVKGELPCHKIYEDELTMAFLDIHPLTEGHTLIISKKQVEFVWDLPAEDYGAVMEATKKIALRLRDILGAKYISERIVGVDVPHAHVQLIPFEDVSQLQAHQDMDSEPNHEELAKLAEKLKF